MREKSAPWRFSRPGIRYLVMTVAVIALTGCGLVDQQPKTPPTATPASPSVAATSAANPPTANPPTASAAPTATAPARAGRPSINSLRAALVVYFRDQQDLSAEKAQRAADCAVYPSYQELSARSLTAIVHHHPTGIDPGDKKVFGDVTTECVTAAG